MVYIVNRMHQLENLNENWCSNNIELNDITANITDKKDF